MSYSTSSLRNQIIKISPEKFWVLDMRCFEKIQFKDMNTRSDERSPRNGWDSRN